MTILKAHFPDGTAFLERYLSDLEQGGLFYPTRRPLAIGEVVVVAIRLGRRRSPTLIRGQVAWRRPAQAARQSFSEFTESGVLSSLVARVDGHALR